MDLQHYIDTTNENLVQDSKVYGILLSVSFFIFKKLDFYKSICMFDLAT